MARLELILQAATPATHAAAVRRLLTINNVKTVLVSVAFVREAGVQALEAALKSVSEDAKFFVGIRNNITTLQGLKRLLALKTELYVVDTGSGETIFHPKLYLACADTVAEMIIGSANLTFQGLHNNIEASTRVVLDMADAEDRKFVEQTIAAFDDMHANYPEHVFRLKTVHQVEQLFDEGRIVDEMIVPAPTPVSGVRKGNRDSLGRMKLYEVFKPKIAAGTKVKAIAQPTPAVRVTEHLLVWQTKQLKRRDLDLPTSKGTSRTYAIGLKKGALQDIDHRHYFRDDVFGQLVWKKEANKSYSELAQATFELVIKNVNYGKFDLWLRHDTRTNTKSYRQHNEMTHLRWGTAVDIIRRPDLLGRFMYLYRKEGTPPQYIIEID